MSNTVELVGIVGGGRMGAGIAQAYLTLGAGVVVVENDHDSATAAHERVRDGLRGAEQRGKIAVAPETLLRRLNVVTDIAELPSEAALVVEAVPESVELKLRVLAAVEHTVSADTVVASNTSSLAIAELATALHRPGRFLGMHFFNPVPASKLVEVIAGPESSTGTVESVCGWARSIGKTDIVVRDSPGFATSRLGVALGLEAIRVLAEGVTDAASVDAAMELGYRHPMGPLRSTDLVGLDVRLAVAEYLHSTLGPRFEPPRLLRDKVQRGELGRKSGRGFHEWHD